MLLCFGLDGHLTALHIKIGSTATPCLPLGVWLLGFFGWRRSFGFAHGFQPHAGADGGDNAPYALHDEESKEASKEDGREHVGELQCADGVSASQRTKKLGYAERGSPLLGLPESGTEVGVLELARGGGVAQRQALSF